MKKISLIAVSIVTAATLLTGCASSTGGSADGAKASSGDINVGFLAGLTGWLGPFTKENINSLLLAKEEINEAGGILDGKKINTIDVDTASTVEGAIKGYQKLVNADKAVVAIGPETESMLALLKEAPKSEVPIMSAFAGSTELDEVGGNYAFRTAASDSTIGEVRAKVLIESGVKEIAIMVGNYEGAQSDVHRFKETYEKLGGKILEEVTFNPGQNTYNGELKKIAKANPKLVYYSGGIDTAPSIFKAAKQRGYAWEWYITPDVAVQEFIDVIGKDVAEGIKTIIAMEDENNQAFKRFNENYEARFKAKPSGGYYNANTYDLLIASALAMQAAGEASGSGINEKIREVTNPPGKQVTTFEEGLKELKAGNDIDYQGASGPIDFDEHGNVISTNALMEVVDGQWKQVEFFTADYIKED
ncbi:ABC transporter substrate-binding protein [Peribacillus saganii]|uniref:ABC transporter substrate-binding protein n=1 Tax=Peribacillus saganii TaxID=2303992 RepID=A0A372LQI0_9BACI|nr:ABC transporter substrate-binding protein [Peribacillus saganii]RFU70483.1 ABC transporter substrate-binding protein [Peribacillus saganii]